MLSTMKTNETPVIVISSATIAGEKRSLDEYIFSFYFTLLSSLSPFTPLSPSLSLPSYLYIYLVVHDTIIPIMLTT